jgi:L-histidine N-alpha-methyltransferase
MTAPATAGGTLAVLLDADDWARSLHADALAGLQQDAKELAPTWLYDDRGSELFDEITRLPEYYPTRAERAALLAHAGEIAAATRPTTLVELGAGTAEKTRVLLDALCATGTLRRYVPFDVAAPTLATTMGAVAKEYPGLEVRGVAGDFRRHLSQLPTSGRTLVAFLGGTVGNLRPAERAAMFRELAEVLRPDDSFLLGTDLVKDRGRLVAAYDDAAGVTAAFNRNVLAVLNRELCADFDVDAFDHVARFDEEHRWIEMHLRATRPMVVRIHGLDLQIELAEGETIRTEISAKFDRQQVASELAAAGFTATGWWTDPDGDFALTLAVR